jgi:NAD(P) transhydrogenase
MERAQEFDLVILGAGPAGVQAATVAGYFGKRVALVDPRSEVGGALVNTGTLPSKTLRETALTLSGVRSRRLQVDVVLKREATVADFLRHERSVAKAERARMGSQLDEAGVRRFTGAGRFADPHTIEVLPVAGTAGEPLRLRGEVIFIATGSSPARPPEFPFEHPRIYDSDEILSLNGMPRSLAVIGAGVIGSEYACTFAALGVDVHLIDGRDVLLPFLDRELSTALAAALADNGIHFRWKERVSACHAPQRGDIRLELDSGASLAVDAVLVAGGRRSNTDDLALERAGLKTLERGLIAVDEDYRTAVPHVFAVGDVIGFPALASTSQEQARLAACIALSLPYKREISALLPSGIYTIPEASAVGATEEQLKERGEALRRRPRALREQPARGDHRGPSGLPEAPLPALGHEAARRARHGRARDRDRPRGHDDHAVRRRRGGAQPRLLQPAHALRPLQGRHLPRADPPRSARSDRRGRLTNEPNRPRRRGRRGGREGPSGLQPPGESRTRRPLSSSPRSSAPSASPRSVGSVALRARREAPHEQHRERAARQRGAQELERTHEGVVHGARTALGGLVEHAPELGQAAVERGHGSRPARAPRRRSARPSHRTR